VKDAPAKPPYFSTRDLMIMAVLAALGGVASTYINAVSDAVHAALGFPGATQWAAGLHVIWIVLAMGILRKPGTGTAIGIIKGGVEFLSGNSHGIIILLVNLVAGLIVDFVFLLFRDKKSLLPYLIAGALASGSNVLVFQIFATLPSNIVAAGAILVVFLVASASGAVFAGLVPNLIVNSLIKANVIRLPEQPASNRKIGWYILAGTGVITLLLTIFLVISLQGSPALLIDGAVANPFTFPDNEFALDQVTRELPYHGVQTEFEGFLLYEIVSYAQPDENANTVLLEAVDGYAFLISFMELQTNPNILLVRQGKGNNTSFDVVGPQSSKAWVRDISKLTIIAAEGLTITNASGGIITFDPDQWLLDMDSTQIALPGGSQKLQGVPLWKIAEAYSGDEQPQTVQVRSSDEALTLTWDEIGANDDLRLFTVIEEDAISFTLAEMSGEVLMYPVDEIEIE